MTVNVQPLSKRLQNGKYESQPPILSIPVACTRCGGFISRPWYKEGDIGIVVYLDHDMDSSVSGGKEAVPATQRSHAATDAIFMGAIISGGYTVPDIPAESYVLATDEGNQYIAITKDKILIKGDVEVEGSVKATGGFIGQGNDHG